MRRTALYSHSHRRSAPPAVPQNEVPPQQDSAPMRPSRLRGLMKRQVPASVVMAALLLPLMAVLAFLAFRPVVLSQEDINAAVAHSLQNNVLPSPATKAYELIRPSVVKVTGLNRKGKKLVENGVGTGVLIIDKGVILTNLHVVLDSHHLQLTYADGSQSDAYVIGMRPEQDLAVLQAQTVPKNVVAATMRSSSQLRSGDQVFAVGFPFGIGPSVTAGVVSGLNRDYMSPEGQRVLSDLIQFDSAANPGNSGGPLVTADGKVVGIVTGILNPTAQRVFIGIGFAVPIESAAKAAGMPPF
jgi:S1-C subfamily serine protease